MKKYDNYEAEELALDSDFRDWVQGKSPNADFWLAYGQQHPERQEVLRTAEELVRAMRVRTVPVAEKLVRAEVSQFMERATQTSTRQKPGNLSASRSLSWRNAYRYAAAIGLLGLLVAAGWWLGKPRNQASRTAGAISPQEVDMAYTETRNSTGKPLRLVLSDNSKVVLGPKSVLRYAPQFSGGERVVYLTGEAQFEVVKRKEPFKVYAGDLVTKVLGTRFVVRAYENDQNVSVQVQSGKVSVYRKEADDKEDTADKAGIILLPNQAAIYQQAEGQLSKTIVARPIVQVPQVVSTNFEFRETPLPQVLNQIQQAYAIPIQFDEEALQNCRITASLANETMLEKVAILCKLVGGRYELVDGQIIVRADGCR
ncbi:FecR family protein [Telluribacter sp.]|jgi:ferric-dicitrate binding protein FerR (iron transport regulator)|uniref:FecR family protein n=1 Tax=Telluribacter sp. TaxID=1978767 RepID=UPI002E0EDA36|nr:FecR domain-containing protein [Telluribacter sp.]